MVGAARVVSEATARERRQAVHDGRPPQDCALGGSRLVDSLKGGATSTWHQV